MPIGNLLIAGAIIFSGASAGQVVHTLEAAKIATISTRTFRQMQCHYLLPAVDNVWGRHQTEVLNTCTGREVKLGGDARCCSPGHTDKYGSYSLMDLETGLVLDMQLVQVNIPVYIYISRSVLLLYSEIQKEHKFSEF